MIKRKDRFKENRQTTTLYTLQVALETGGSADRLGEESADRPQNSTTNEQDQLTISYPDSANRGSLLKALLSSSTPAEFERAYDSMLGETADLENYSGNSPKQALCAMFGNKPFADIWDLACKYQSLCVRGISLPPTKRTLDQIDLIEREEMVGLLEITDSDDFYESVPHI